MGRISNGLEEMKMYINTGLTIGFIKSFLFINRYNKYNKKVLSIYYYRLKYILGLILINEKWVDLYVERF